MSSLCSCFVTHTGMTRSRHRCLIWRGWTWAKNLGKSHKSASCKYLTCTVEEEEAQGNWKLCLEMTSRCWFVTAQLSPAQKARTCYELRRNQHAARGSKHIEKKIRLTVTEVDFQIESRTYASTFPPHTSRWSRHKCAQPQRQAKVKVTNCQQNFLLV